MLKIIKRITLLGLLLIFAADVTWCQTPSGCPVLPSLASSKESAPGGEQIVIWFFNKGRKPTRGIQFELFMLDAVGNRYPASQRYVATGEIKPLSGDVVTYFTDDEKAHFGDTWKQIEGVEVRVTRVMFTDNTVWVPLKGQLCNGVYMNDQYQPELDRRWKAVGKKKQQEQKRSSDDKSSKPQ